MRIRFPNPLAARFRVRTLLLLVAVVAIVLEGAREGIRWARYGERARISREAELSHRRAAMEQEEFAALRDREAAATIGPRAIALTEEARHARRQAEGFRALADWSGQLATKYDRARRSPWRGVGPDPPFRANEFMIGTPGW